MVSLFMSVSESCGATVLAIQKLITGKAFDARFGASDTLEMQCK